MFTDLWKEVREQLLAHFDAGRFKAVHQGTRWGFQTVDLEDGDLIVRVVHERGTYEARFLSRAAPAEWYTLNEVLTYLELPPQPLMPPLGVSETLAELRQLLARHGESLRGAFDRSRYTTARTSLLEIRVANRAAQKGNAKRVN